MKKIPILLLFTITFGFNLNAQLGGLIKKAKEKVSEKKAGDSNTTKVGSQSGNNNQENNAAEVTNTAATMPKGENTPEGYSLVNNPLGKITCSNKPFTNGMNNTQSTFNSNEFIYGRLLLNSGTIKEAFKIGDKGENIPFYSIQYVVNVYKKGEKKFNNDQLWNSCLVKEADLTKNYFDFDVLPNPQNATTIMSALENFSAGKGTAPLYSAISPQVFYEDGMYKVKVLLRYPAKDGWGKEIDIDKWPLFETDFDFSFSSNGIATLKKNSELASTNAKNNMQGIATAAEPLPAQWTEKSSAPTMGFTQAQLIAMYQNSFSTKLDPHTVVKFHASASGGGWSIQKNEFGIPVYRYSNQWYTIFIKYANGKTCFFQGFGLRQQYSGGGTYDQAFIDKNDYHMVDCEKMK